MKDIYCLAIESSCDETSVSIVKNGTTEIATVTSTQIDIHALYGGVVPEIASRKHIENITIILNELLIKSKMKIEDIDFIAVTYGPGLIGSLLIGVMTAKTLSFIYKKPIVPVHHIAGHIYASNLTERLSFPLIALVVSGGHTELIYMDADYSFKKIGETLDDAVGEAYDKVGRILELPYPAGPKLDSLAHRGKDTYNLPTPLDDESYNFSFSGLKSACMNLKNTLSMKKEVLRKEDLAASFQNRVVKILVKKTIKAALEYNVKNIIIAGGVAANSGLRDELKKAAIDNSINLIIPDLKNCTDNATMIASAGYYAFLKNGASELDFNAKATESLF